MSYRHALRRHWAPLVTVAIGLAISFAMVRVASGWESARAERAFDETAIRVEDATQSALNGTDRSLRGLVGWYAASSFVDRNEFSTYAQAVVDPTSGVQAWEWVPRVAASERSSIVEAAIADGIDGFEVRERLDSGALIPAVRRDFYYPVLYADPARGQRTSTGVRPRLGILAAGGA